MDRSAAERPLYLFPESSHRSRVHRQPDFLGRSHRYEKHPPFFARARPENCVVWVSGIHDFGMAGSGYSLGLDYRESVVAVVYRRLGFWRLLHVGCLSFCAHHDSSSVEPLRSRETKMRFLYSHCAPLHELPRTRPSRRGCKRTPSRAGSLSVRC
jgi:hypothetical protein